MGPVTKDGRSVDHIGVKDESVTIVLGQNDIGLTLKESALKIDTSEGTMYFDRELGAVVERSITTRVVGKVTLLANGADLPLVLDLKFTSTHVRQK